MSSNTKPGIHLALSEAQSDAVAVALDPEVPTIERRRNKVDRRKQIERRSHNSKAYHGEPRRMTIDRRASSSDRRKRT